MLNIGLIDVDGHHFPNLALMKLSAYHKGQGDTVGWYSAATHYDKVYMSKVFTYTPDESREIRAGEVIRGGSGYGLFDQWLPHDVEHICPDYSLYPMYKEAYGFLTRGCVNTCSFCIVPRKEGVIRAHADITEFLDGRKSTILMDNNVIACDWGLSQIEKIISLKTKVDFTQGLDCRLIAKDKSIAGLLKRVSWIRYVRMAYDHSPIREEVETAIAYLKEAGIPAYKMFFYILVRDGQIEDAQRRALSLDQLGCTPFAMPYRDLENNTPPTQEQRRFARWVNMKAIFKSCTYEQYKG